MNALPLKICGLTRGEDARLCAEIGAAYVGFIFVAASPRCITPERVARLDTGGALRVGVFAGTPPDEVRRIMALARLDYAQLHGGESPDLCRAVGPERVIKVLWPEALAAAAKSGPVSGPVSGPALGSAAGEVGGKAAGVPTGPAPGANPGTALDALYAECERFAPVCSLFLLDAGQRGGGGGRSLAFEALRDFRPSRPWLLAGGLGPDNLAVAAATCSPHAFDCNSALEEAPGRKSAALVRAAAEVLRKIET